MDWQTLISPLSAPPFFKTSSSSTSRCTHSACACCVPPTCAMARCINWPTTPWPQPTTDISPCACPPPPKPTRNALSRSRPKPFRSSMPEVVEPEPPEGRSNARRGGVAPRADLSNPNADAVSVPASKSLQINGKSTPASFLPSSSTVAASVASGRVALGLSKGRRQPLKLLGKSVPVVLLEYAMPYKLIAEIGPTSDWSGRRGSNP